MVLTPISPIDRQIEFLIKVTDFEGNEVSKVDTLSIVSYEHNLPHFTTLSQNHTENYISEDYSVFNFSFEAIHTNESYTQTLCYPTVNDCSEQDGTFTHDMHNSNYGDFNGDGYEDLVVSWAVFPHTLERETTKSTIEIYLNDQKGRLIKDHDFFFDRLPPERMMNYRVLVDDFNQDGIDDIFAGTSGLHKRNPDGTWYFKGDSHVLLISDTGVMVDASSIIEGNDGLSAHDASSGDVNGDGYPDILSGRKLFINNKGISFTDDTEKLPEVWKQNYQKYQYPMSSLLEDFNGDGLAEIVIFWNDDEENTDPPFPEILMSDINQIIILGNADLNRGLFW